jgi:FixJ family two-component response regulator
MAQELRHSGWKTPIVMLTSIGKATGLSYGADPDVVPVDAFLEKPVRPSVLIETVAALIARERGKEENHAGHGTTTAAR